MEIINLDMTPSTVTPNAHAGQYDASRTVRFMLKNGGVPFTLAGTETITAEITRSDNTEATVNVENTSSNYVDVVFDDTVCTVKGLYACELRLKDSDGLDIGSKNFALLVQRDPYDGAGIHVVTVGPADICTFETTLAEPLQSVIVDIEATGGNGTPDNPNPINGYTEANITRCGVNLWDEEWEEGSINATTGADEPSVTAWRSIGYIAIKPDTAYYVAFQTATGKAARPRFYDINKNYIGSTPKSGAVTTGSTFVPPDGAYYLRISPLNENIPNHDISINYPSTDTTYHAYTGNTYTIAFGQTVYGGVLDVTRGKLTVYCAKATFDLSQYTPTTANGYDSYLLSLTDLATDNAGSSDKKLCNVCNRYSWSGSTVGYEHFYIGGANAVIYLEENTYRSGTVEFSYPLATPFDIDLTPEVISAVVGENNVFADCGETTVKYLKAGE